MWIAANTTLKIGGLRGGGVNKSGNGTLEISGTIENPGASTVSEGTIAFVDTTVAVPLTVNAGKTVTASASEGVTVPLNVTMNASANITVSGAGTVNGTLTYSGVPSGTLTGLTTSTWEGTVVLGALNAPTALPLNNLGNANSKIVLTGTTGNCYLNGTTTVAAEVVVGTDENSVVEFNNGNSNQVGTFGKVSGPGTLKLVGWTGCSAATYVLSTLDNFEGLAIANNITRDGGGTFTVRIGNIVTTRTTNPGDCVLPIANTAVDNATGTVVYDLTNAKVNGNTLDLEAKDDGIYVVVPTVTVTVPAVANTTVTVVVGEETIGTAAGNYDVDPGSVVTVTYAAAPGYQITGTTEYTIDTASATTFDPTETTQVAQIVATITSADGETVTPYTSVATAFTSVDDDETLTLVGTAVTLASDVTVEKSYTLAGDAQGTTVTGAGKIYLTGSAELTLDATLTSVGNQFWFSSKDAKLTFPTECFSPVVRPYTAGGCQTGSTVNGDGTTTYYQYLFLTLQVGATNVTLAYADTEDPLVMKQVYEGDEIVFTATPAEGYENVVVTVNGDTQTPVDGKYTVVVGTVNVVIQATATAMPKVAEIVGGDQYTSLGAAIAAATDGDTVKLLADADGVVGANANDITLDLAGFTVTGGDAIKWTGAGKLTIVDSVGGGKAIATAEDGCAIWVTGGSVEVQAGYFQNSSEEEATVYVGVAGASATITGGTFKNTVQDYKWAGSDFDYYCLNVGNSLSATSIQVSGGSFSHDPAKGDDKLGSLLADGYASTWNPSTSYYDVAEVQKVPVTPGAQTDPVDTYAEAEAEAAKVVPSVPTAVAEALSDDQETAYKALFEPKVVEVPGETTQYAVEVVLKESVAADIQTAVDAEAEDLAKAAVDAAADATNGGEATVATTPGLYYVVEAGSEVDAITPASCTLATTESTKLTIPNKGTSGFYKISVSVTPVDIP